MPPLQGGMCMEVDLRKHPFAPGLPLGRVWEREQLKKVLKTFTEEGTTEQGVEDFSKAEARIFYGMNSKDFWQ